MGQGIAGFFLLRAATSVLAFRRKLSQPVSKMRQRCLSRPSRTVVILASAKDVGHSLKLRLLVMMTLVRS